MRERLERELKEAEQEGIRSQTWNAIKLLPYIEKCAKQC